MAVKQRGDPDPPLESIAHTELRQFTAKATVMEVSELLDIAQPGKRQTLRLTLPRQARMRCQDELVEMMLRRIRRTQALTREQLKALHDQHRGIEEVLISVFGQLLETAHVQGGVDTLAAQCETVSAWHRDNDLPLLRPIHARHRALLFRLIDLLDIRSATQNRSLLNARAIVSTHTRRPDVQADIDLGFASQRWRNFVVRRRPEVVVDRRALEVCVFIHLVHAANRRPLRCGRSSCPGSSANSGHRPTARSSAFPNGARIFAAMLKAELTAAAVDAGLLDNAELSIGEDEAPHLRQMAARSPPAGLADFEQEVRARMPERHLLEILKRAEHWSRYTRHFGPPSGTDPKLSQAAQRYLRSSRRVSRDNGMRERAKNITVPQTWQAIVGRRRFVRRIPWTGKLPLNGRCRSRPECGQLRDSRVNSTLFALVPA